MQISYNVEAFRRNPKLGVGLGAIVLLIGAFGMVHAYSSLKTLPRAPQEMTIEEAVPSPDAIPEKPQWVSLPGGLKPNCNQVLQEKSSGSVTGIRVLASDSSAQRWFWVRLKGDVSCEAAAAPLVGVLNKADSALPAWIRDKGLDVPVSNYPLMEISVGEGPGDAKLELWIFGGMGLLGLVTVVFFLRMKPS